MSKKVDTRIQVVQSFVVTCGLALGMETVKEVEEKEKLAEKLKQI